MRTLTAAVISELAAGGNEFSLVLEVAWAKGGPVKKYAEFNIPIANGIIPGKINTRSDIDNSTLLSGVAGDSQGAETQQVNIVLDDTDGTLKSTIHGTDIHKSKASVYVYVDNTDYDADKIFWFAGEISSPIEWDETQRELSFSIVNQVDSVKVGFSVEEGVDAAREDLIGRPWPLAFGSVFRVPALRLNEIAKGTLEKGFPIKDFTLLPRIQQSQRISCPVKDNGLKCHATGLTGVTNCNTWWILDPACVCRQAAELFALEQSFALQVAEEVKSKVITIFGGNSFPQGVPVTLNFCEDAEVTGIFSGETFTVTSRKHPMRDELVVPEIKTFRDPGEDYFNSTRFGLQPVQGNQSVVGPTVPFAPCTEEQDNAANFNGFDYLASFPIADFYWCQAGSEIVFTTETVYVANLISSTVNRVEAFRTINGNRQLMSVPDSLYTTRVSDYNEYMVTEVVLPKPLSKRGEGWEDELYITMDSTVGPNPVDVIEWIIAKYIPNSTTDATSFAAVKTKIDTYSTHFSIHTDRPKALDVVRKIAEEGRCALVLRNNEFKLLYLPEEPAADFTITSADILPGNNGPGFRISHTKTENLMTKINGSWQDDYSFEKPKKFTHEYNVGPYGVLEHDMEFISYTHYMNITKSATFWLQRRSVTWQIVKFRVPLSTPNGDYIAIEVLDAIDLSYPEGFVPGTIRCIVREAIFDPDAWEMQLELWTPVRAGETVPWTFSFPAQIEERTFWPTDEDIERRVVGGDSPNVNVEPPALSPIIPPRGWSFGGIANREVRCTQFTAFTCEDRKESHGDTFPSDINDKKPEVNNPGGEVAVPNETPPTGRPDKNAVAAQTCCSEAKADAAKAQEAANQAKEGQTDSGDTGSGEESSCEDAKTKLGPKETQDCRAVVRVCWSNPVALVDICGGGTSSMQGATGRNLTSVGDSTNCERFYYNSLMEAQRVGAFYASIANSYSATVGQPWPAGGATGDKTADDGTWFSESPACQEPEIQELYAYEAGGNPSAGGIGEGTCGSSDPSNPLALSFEQLNVNGLATC